MVKITKEAALAYHHNGRPGKIEVKPTKPYRTQTDLSLAYSPGVAFPCLEIQKNPDDVYKYTDKGNLVAVISNGTAVLGLGDIGAMSGKPVMEGKGLLFKIYGGIDVFDIEVNEKDPEKFCEAVEKIAPTFGGINLEDIKAPECFYIENRLKKNLDIPVMHDDQHGTAIISAAGLLNALEVAGKKIEDAKIVVNGAGAAAISCTKLYCALGAKHENIVMLDSRGVIYKGRDHVNEQKAEFATDRTDIHTLEEAIKGADVFVGLSKGNVLSQDMVRSMAHMPIVFALANPVPEISYEDATAARPDILMSTGRSDYPNQINNVIGFPYIFRGALDVHAKAINEEMKLAAVRAIANLAKQPVPDIVNFSKLLRKTDFAPVMTEVMALLEERYNYPVDIEYACNFTPDGEYKVNLLQCRTIQTQGLGQAGVMPKVQDFLFRINGNFMGGNACVPIRYAVFVQVEAYLDLPESRKYQVARKIGELNQIITEDGAILMGPGRWGTTTPSLGVPVSFAEISHYACMCELSYQSHGLRPELSYGSHFFQDLVETGIHYAAIYREEKDCIFREDLFEQYPEVYEALTGDTILKDVIRVYDLGKGNAILYSELKTNDCFLGTT